MLTLAPARWAKIADVNPKAPQPTTAMFLSPAAMAFSTANELDPQDNDQPLPPWP